MTNAEQRLAATRIQVGDAVKLAGGPSCWLEVVSTDDPSLLTLRAPSGVEVKAGRQTVAEIHRKVDNLALRVRG